jgi:molybdate transport system ATP-binding protein
MMLPQKKHLGTLIPTRRGCVLTMREAAFRLGEDLVFENTNWCYAQQEQWAVTGGNGSGKSLFLEAVRGNLPIVRGEIRYQFRPPAGFSGEEAISQVCFEDRKLDVQQMVLQSRWNSLEQEDALRARDFLSYDRVMDVNPFEVTDRHGRERTAFSRRVARAIRLLQIEPLLDRLVISLSHGERQKLQIARALSRPLRLLLLDEPFAGLDASSRISFREALEHLMASGLHVIIATTRPEDLPSTITRILEIDRLRVVSECAHRQRGSGPRRPDAGGFATPKSRRKPQRPSTARPLIKLTNVRIQYGDVTVLEDVSWSIGEGERWALVGRNGSGKSTLLGLITGDHPQAYVNDVEVFGRRRGEGDSVWETRKEIGMVSPELHLHFDSECSCSDVVASGFYDTVGLYRRPSARQRAQARRWLDRLRLRCGEEPYRTRSLGEQRMVLIARAMVKEPRLLILDEPCQGLDPEHRRLVISTVEGIARRHRATILYVTHRKDEIPASIDRVMKLA